MLSWEAITFYVISGIVAAVFILGFILRLLNDDGPPSGGGGSNDGGGISGLS
jgi:hypothetical protein